MDATDLQTARELVRSMSVGSRVAEQEVEQLANYFVKTEDWRRVRQGEVDIIFAPKGGGKSAIYAMLMSLEDDLFDEGVLLVAAENPKGDAAFSVVNNDTTETEFRDLWKLYFIVLLVSTFSDYSFKSDADKRLVSIIGDAGLLPDKVKRRQSIVSNILHYIRRITRSGIQSVETGVTIGPEGPSVTPRIVFRETTEADRQAGIASINDLMELAQESLESSDHSVWILLDRLDAAFIDSADLERNALRGLFRAYQDMQVMANVSLRIFLRSDIWESITKGGFREASHITRNLEIHWNYEDLMQLVVQRLMQNLNLVNHFGSTQAEILADATSRQKFFYTVFPSQVDPGEKKSETFVWCLSRTADGKKTNAPRELIHLMEEVRLRQIKLFELGTASPVNGAIFDSRAFKEALPSVSMTRLNQTLLAENPDLQGYLEALKGEKTRQNVESLMRVWDCSHTDASRIAEELVAVGFFESRQNDFWVPFLYRPGLGMVQGSAAGVTGPDSDSDTD